MIPEHLVNYYTTIKYLLGKRNTIVYKGYRICTCTEKPHYIHSSENLFLDRTDWVSLNSVEECLYSIDNLLEGRGQNE